MLKLYDGYEAGLKLLTPEERIGRFLGWRNYELVIGFDGRGYRISMYFQEDYSAKGTQRSYPRSWRFAKGIRRAIEEHVRELGGASLSTTRTSSGAWWRS